MKKLFTFIFIMLSAFLYCQSPYQIVDTTKTWNTIIYGAGSWNVWNCGGTYINKIEGETVLFGKTYLKVYESNDSLQTWEYVGNIRQDTINQKVYFLGYSKYEGLLYDFNIEAGDSVFIDNFYTNYNSLLICDEIDSVYINGSYRKQFNFISGFSNGFYPAETWIEGIGSLNGLLYSGMGGIPMAGGGTELLCSHENDTLTYMNSFFGDCYIDEFYPQILQDTYDTAYVNTFYEFQLTFNTFEVDSFALRGEVIPAGFYFNESTGLLTGTPTQTGNFTCIITAQNFDLGGALTDMIYEEIHVVLPTSIKQHSEQAEFNISPNPSKGTFQIHSKQQENLSFQKLTIYNLEGKVVFVSENPELLQSDIMLPSLPNGMYFAQIAFRENTYSVKFLIQH